MTNPDEQRPVKLPVIDSFAIEGYQLFPGEDGRGIRHDVSDGVTIIVGLNGLGKKTLLNALYRCLTGPVQSGLMTLFNLGSQKPGLLDYRAADYFGNRVEDGAREATIELSVRFGGDELRIRRNLRTLNLTHLECRGIAQEPHEQAYRERVIELANLPRFEDFLVLLHYVVFVFEDRPKLIWDPSAQAELFRFVVNPASAATQYRTAFDRIASLDSERRNLRVQANRLRKQVDKARAAGATNRPLQARVDMLTTDLEGVKKAMPDQVGRLLLEDPRCVQPVQVFAGQSGADDFVVVEVAVGERVRLADVVEKGRKSERLSVVGGVDGSKGVIPEVLALDLVLADPRLAGEIRRDNGQKARLSPEP